MRRLPDREIEISEDEWKQIRKDIFRLCGAPQGMYGGFWEQPPKERMNE